MWNINLIRNWGSNKKFPNNLWTCTLLFPYLLMCSSLRLRYTSIQRSVEPSQDELHCQFLQVTITDHLSYPVISEIFLKKGILNVCVVLARYFWEPDESLRIISLKHKTSSPSMDCWGVHWTQNFILWYNLTLVFSNFSS